jgi:peptidoglycan/xylan/chitin deacetylase (PgdA/CDA1 family)
VPVLMYHGIGTTPRGGFSRFVVPDSLLGEQVDGLSMAGYRCVGLSALVDAVDRGEDLTRVVAITFDDAFADVAERAVPILTARGAAATVYVPTGYIGRTASWLTRARAGDRPVMGWSALADVAAAGFEVGAHGITHVALDTVGSRVAAREMADSRSALEEGLGIAVRSMAYPFGYETSSTRRLAREAGYATAVAVRYALWDTTGDRHAIARLLVGPHHSPDALLALVRGSAQGRLVRRAKRIVAPAWRGARILVPALTPRAPRGAR